MAETAVLTLTKGLPAAGLAAGTGMEGTVFSIPMAMRVEMVVGRVGLLEILESRGLMERLAAKADGLVAEMAETAVLALTKEVPAAGLAAVMEGTVVSVPMMAMRVEMVVGLVAEMAAMAAMEETVVPVSTVVLVAKFGPEKLLFRK